MKHILLLKSWEIINLIYFNLVNALFPLTLVWETNVRPRLVQIFSSKLIQSKLWDLLLQKSNLVWLWHHFNLAFEPTIFLSWAMIAKSQFFTNYFQKNWNCSFTDLSILNVLIPWGLVVPTDVGCVVEWADLEKSWDRIQGSKNLNR